ncbi:MAG TPA: phosphoglycerate mutase, partial [Bacteroidetes bacterium]|nr:phosphoglycerate mutase [Bacteroidota bacterium]
GEDGNFAGKVAAIEEVDAALPRITALQPQVLLITGDHSTPCAMGAHSWHPVPVLLSSPLARRDDVTEFSENACITGGLGQIQAQHIMNLVLAHAGRLIKFGA